MTRTQVDPATVPGVVDPVAQRAGTTIITKHFSFESAHFLPNVAEDHKCRRMHGHSYQVWIHVGGPLDEAAGWVVDFSEVKHVWKPIEAELDHHVLNEIAGLENPTAENLAAWIWRRLSDPQLGLVGARIAAVEVAETADSKAMFVAPTRQPWVPGHPHVTIGLSPEEPGDEFESLDSRATTHVFDDVAEAPMEDVQSRRDERGVALDEVGVSQVRVPIEVLDRDRGRQATVANVTMAVDLPPHVKGTHLSRFLQALRAHPDAFTLFALGGLTGDLRDRLNAHRVRARIEFPYFITKAAPVSGELGDLDVDAVFEVIDRGGRLEHWLEVVTPITTVCPCSRDISDYGAHNQRGRVSIRVLCAQDEAELPALVWIEELVGVAEAVASSPVYPVIKRPDERYVTMAGYDNPKFVEDVARDVAIALRDDARVSRFEVAVENDESIHAHNAFARVTGGPSGDSL